jgi:hypothetical protein
MNKENIERGKDTAERVKKYIEIAGKKILDERASDPGYEEADIFFCPMDVLVGDNAVWKIDFTDNRDREKYAERLTKLVIGEKKSSRELILTTIPIEVADSFDFANMPTCR